MNVLLARRSVLSLALGTMALGATGCWGSFAATGKLWKFNDEISSSKWIKWLLFLGLVIIPVYSLFILGDALIFNTIEFFTDKNPISSDIRDLGNGNMVAFERDKNDPSLVRVEHRREQSSKTKTGGFVVVGVWYVRRIGDHFQVLDAQQHLIAETREHEGMITLLDGSGHVLVSLQPDELKKVSRRTQETGSPQLALDELVGPNTPALAARNRSISHL